MPWRYWPDSTARVRLPDSCRTRFLLRLPSGRPPGLPSELLERRPDISAAERLNGGGNANTLAGPRAAFLPSVQLCGLAALGWLPTWAPCSIGPAGFGPWGPSLSLPLFEGGKLRAGLRLAQATYEETVANYRQIRLDCIAEVEDNLAAQNLRASSISGGKRGLACRPQQLQIANNRYREGLVTFLEVATAESTELNVEFSTVQLRGQRLVAGSQPLQETPGGWQEPDRTGAATQRLSESPGLRWCGQRSPAVGQTAGPAGLGWPPTSGRRSATSPAEFPPPGGRRPPRTRRVSGPALPRKPSAAWPTVAR